MTVDHALPRTKDNLLLAQAGEGTRVELQGIVKSYAGVCRKVCV